MLFWLFLTSALCAIDSLSTIIERVKHLHSRTGYSTFYELLNLCENASLASIKKAYRKLQRSAPINGMSRLEYENLLSSTLSTLTGLRKEYDNFLKNSRYIFLDKKENYRNHAFLLLFVFVILLFFIDGLVYLLRYLRYIKDVERYNEAKSKKDGDGQPVKKRGKIPYPAPPSLFISTLLRKLMRCALRR